jgi:hypothetical protein
MLHIHAFFTNKSFNADSRFLTEEEIFILFSNIASFIAANREEIRWKVKEMEIHVIDESSKN